MTTTDSPECLLTHDLQASALWEKLRLLSFDRGTGPRTFAGRLASEQNWSEAFAALAINEYRRFLLLYALDARERAGNADTSRPIRVVPPAIVDKVWHLHLLYTQSYWEDLCRDILTGPLHHVPADGTSGESANLSCGVRRTLAAYRRTFGCSAPTLVWPGADSSAERTPPAGTRPARAFVGVGVLIGVGLFVLVLLTLGHLLPPMMLVPAGIVAVFLLGAVNSRRPARRKYRPDGNPGGDSGSYFGGDISGGTSTDTHHGGGSHDGGGHSHSCGGGHSCGGHGCGGHGCGGH